MNKEYLIEKLNRTSDENLRKEIGGMVLTAMSPGIFSSWDVLVKVPDIKKAIEGTNQIVDGKIVGDDCRYVRVSKLVDLIISAYFYKYQEDKRRRYQEEFIHKVDMIQKNLDNLLEATQQ